MDIHTIVTKVRDADRVLEVDVEQTGMVVTVKAAGVVCFEDGRHTLPEDIEFTAAADANTTVSVSGYLVLDSEGEVALLVDETGGPFGADCYVFEGSPYETLRARLFTFHIPPGATDLDDVETYLWKSEVAE